LEIIPNPSILQQDEKLCPILAYFLAGISIASKSPKNFIIVSLLIALRFPYAIAIGFINHNEELRSWELDEASGSKTFPEISILSILFLIK